MHKNESLATARPEEEAVENVHEDVAGDERGTSHKHDPLTTVMTRYNNRVRNLIIHRKPM